MHAWGVPFQLECLRNSSTQKSPPCHEHGCPTSTASNHHFNRSKPCCQPVKAMLQNWSTGKSRVAKLINQPKHFSAVSESVSDIMMMGTDRNMLCRRKLVGSSTRNLEAQELFVPRVRIPNPWHTS